MSELLAALWILCFFGGPYLAYTGYKAFQKIRRIEDTSTARTATAPMGNVELQGYAWPAVQITAPLHQTEVVLFELVGHMKTGERKVTVEAFRITSEEPFFIADDRGLSMVRVQPGDEIHSEAALNQYWSNLNNSTQELILRLLSAQGISLYGQDLRDLQIVETIIQPSSHLYVHGEMTPATEKDKGYTPANGISEFMLSERKRHIIEFIKNQKRLISKDIPWAKSFVAKKNDLARIPTENPWTTWTGVMRTSALKPMIIGSEWETELKDLIGTNYLWRIVAGGILFAIGVLPVLMLIF